MLHGSLIVSCRHCVCEQLRATEPCARDWQLPRRSKPDEYAVEGVDYTDWTSEDEGEDAAAGVEQVRGCPCTKSAPVRWPQSVILLANCFMRCI